MRVVLDSGILVRVSPNPAGPAGHLLKELLAVEHRVLISDHILAEVERVLAYPRIACRHRLTAPGIRNHVDWLRSVAEPVVPSAGPPIVLADPKDDPVVYTAIAGKADVLCTLDRHFYEPDVVAFLATHRIRVLSDVELLRELLLGRGIGHSV